MSNVFVMIGRVLLGLLFVTAALFKLKGAVDAGGLKNLAGYIASRGLPFPEIIAPATIAFELIGGLALIFGFFVLPVSALMAGFCVVSALFFHNFWSFPIEQLPNQFNHFIKNAALAGAFLILFGDRLRS
jgi:putative oxidoreductase